MELSLHYIPEHENLLRLPSFVLGQDPPDDSVLLDLAYSMIGRHQDWDAYGIAAPQIGHMRRLFTYSLISKDPKAVTWIVINPVITKHSFYTEKKNEGCLSLPRLRADIERPESIEVQFYDAKWKFYERKLSGLEARIFQHECDHLGGKLFIDHLPEKVRAKKLQEYLSWDSTKARLSASAQTDFPSAATQP